MYRRDRMASIQAAESNEGLKSQFFQHLANIPAIHLAWDYASQAYGSVKAKNSLVNYTLTTAERAGWFMTEQTKPVAMKFEKQIKAIDLLACKGIMNLEAAAPFITKPPEQIVHYTRHIYAETIQDGLNKYEGVKQYGLSKVKQVSDFGLQKTNDILASPYGQLILIALDNAMDVTDSCIDHFLPPVGDEEYDGPFGDRVKPPVAERFNLLSTKLRERMYKHSLLQLQKLQIYIRSTVAKLHEVLDLIQVLRENNHRISENIIENALQLLRSLSSVLFKDQDIAGKSIDQLIIIVARNMANQLVTACEAAMVAMHTMPQQVQERVVAAHQFSLALYNNFYEVTGIAQLNDSIVTSIREKLRAMEEAMASFRVVVEALFAQAVRYRHGLPNGRCHVDTED